MVKRPLYLLFDVDEPVLGAERKSVHEVFKELATSVVDFPILKIKIN